MLTNNGPNSSEIAFGLKRFRLEEQKREIEKKIFFKKIQPQELRYLDSSRFKSPKPSSKGTVFPLAKLAPEKRQIFRTLDLVLKQTEETSKTHQFRQFKQHKALQPISSEETSGTIGAQKISFSKIQKKNLILLLKENLELKRS